MKFKNKKSKLFLVLGASTLALGSIGFASWIIGVQQTSATENLNVTVDTTQLSNVTVEVQMTKKAVTIKETTAVTDPDALIKPSEHDAQALKFSIDNIKVTVGTGVSQLDRPTHIKVSLPVEINTANKVADTYNLIETTTATKYRTGATEWTYLEYSKEIALNYQSGATGDAHVFEIKDFVDQQFELGTYFDYTDKTGPKTSVSEFYNTVYKNSQESTQFKSQQAVNIKAELDQMHTALNKDGALTLKVELLKK